MTWISHPVSTLSGAIRAPGDKSCSHRALMFAMLAEGKTHITGLLESDDVLHTLAACRALGAEIRQMGPGNHVVVGRGGDGLLPPDRPLDFGNSGTGARLMMGLVAGQGITAEFVGDASLSSRPMERILKPLRKFGVDARSTDGRLPVTVHAGRLNPASFALEIASAQVKSAILLAALGAEGRTEVIEPKPSRDHTERMLRAFGVALEITRRDDGGRSIALTGPAQLKATDVAVPGDPSSAAFALAAGLISPKGQVQVESVMSNATRTGLFELLTLMGAELGAEDVGESGGERIINMTAVTSGLRGVDVPERLVPAMIDEFPLLGVLASFAAGTTRVRGAEELRVKESDRITATVDLLLANGVEAEETPDGFIVQGCGGPPPGGGHVETRHDHRIAMSALVMGTATRAPVRVDDVSMIATSYPGFQDHMTAIGARIERETE